MSFARQFTERRDKSCELLQENGVEVLAVTEPTQLANFVAFCKARRRRIFLRGHSSVHPTLFPTLFREGGANNLALWTAYNALIGRLSASVRGTRFRQRNFGAVLQHYGFRTPWLDVVDDLHAAIWFALHDCHRLKDDSLVYRPVTRDHGWVTLVSPRRDLRVQDLRETQSSRNTRCHVQQGFSIAMQNDGAESCEPNQDLTRYVVATVRVPKTDRWRVTGFRASQAYFFPDDTADDTYAKLRSVDLAILVAKVEAENGLKAGALGRVAVYAQQLQDAGA